jgi:hypothetical protein
MIPLTIPLPRITIDPTKLEVKRQETLAICTGYSSRIEQKRM